MRGQNNRKTLRFFAFTKKIRNRRNGKFPTKLRHRVASRSAVEISSHAAQWSPVILAGQKATILVHYKAIFDQKKVFTCIIFG